MFNPELPRNQYRLCYVDGNWAYFTSAELSKQWGDDWNDAPYEHNAEEPYEWDQCYPDRDYAGDIIKLAFDADLVPPSDGQLNSPWSVEQINAGAVAWLRSPPWASKTVVIPSGCTIVEFFRLVRDAGGNVYAPADELPQAHSQIEEPRSGDEVDPAA